jgi:hypothetical protein
VLCPKRIGLERQLQRLVKWTEFVEGCAPLVRRLGGFGCSDPFSNGVSRQSGTLGYLMQRELVAEVHPPDFSQHFHADHPVFSCSKSEQKQLNTWVSFQSAEQPLLGQFSVSGNTLGFLSRSVARGRYPFCFQAAEHALHRRVVPAISPPAHALAHAITPQPLAKESACILRSLVRVE